jgi:hypothetical protein
MSELTVLQAVRLKGRVSEAGLAAALGIPLTAVAETIAPLVESGLLVAGKTVKVSPEGRDRLATLLAEERSAIDQAAMASAYDQFRIVNGELKSLVSDWQIRNDEPNTHEDANYDESVLTRLGGCTTKYCPSSPRSPHRYHGWVHTRTGYPRRTRKSLSARPCGSYGP